MRYYPNPYYEKKRKSKFNPIEIKHLAFAWVAITFAFANVLVKGQTGSSFLGVGSYGGIVFLEYFVISGIAVGFGFLFHELAHRFIARKFGMIAEFRASMMMLLFAVLISFSGFVFAAPGAVLIMGRPTKRQNGIISLSGPLSNLIMAVVFFIVAVVVLGAFGVVSPFVAKLFMYGFMINTWLALFNLIPISLLDGRKIFNWNKAVWGITTGFAVLLFILQMGMIRFG
jgi:Zn-dependent protease